MEKSRSLTNEEFIKILQLEYLSCKLRSIIYDRPEFKKMNEDIAEKKKFKILDLSKKFLLPNIFELDEAFEFFWKKEFIQEYGLPNFQYNPKSKELISYWDKFYLLKPGETVIWEGTEYTIKANHPNENSVRILKNGVSSFVPYIYFKIKLLYTLPLEKLK